MLRLISVLLCLSCALFLNACEDDDANNLAQAQKCFDRLTDSGLAAEADTCLAYINGQTSTEAYSLKCGLYFWQGGLRTNTIITAFDAYDAAPSNQKEAVLLDNLALSSTSAANSAYNACLASEVSGLIYIASLSKLATTMESIVGGDGAADAIIDDCLADTTNCANAETGQLLVTVSQYYCSGQSSSNDVCQSIQASINANGSNYAQIAQDFLNSINY